MVQSVKIVLLSCSLILRIVDFDIVEHVVVAKMRIILDLRATGPICDMPFSLRFQKHLEERLKYRMDRSFFKFAMRLFEML